MDTHLDDHPLTDLMSFLMDDMPQPLTPAERSKQWRETARIEGRPEMRSVDSAIAESTGFLMSLAQRGDTIMIDARDLVRVATIVLFRDGHDRHLSKAGVVDRLRERQRHDGHEAMPSRRPHRLDRMIQPPAGGRQWEQRDIDYMRRLTGQELDTPVTSSYAECQCNTYPVIGMQTSPHD